MDRVGPRNGRKTVVTFTASKLLCLIALVCFVLATFGVGLPIVQLVPLGLTFLAASFLVP
jgi:fatty acid desaturase